VTAEPCKTQPLDWSNLSAEKVAADILKSSCNIQMLRSLEETGDIFDPQRPILNLYHFSQVLMAYNSEASIKMQPCEVRSDGTTWPVGSYHCTETPKPVYMRMVDNRFEGCGYFGEPLSSASSVQPSSTMSAIVHIDIEPIIDTGPLINTLTKDSVSREVITSNGYTEAKVKSYFALSVVLTTSVEMLFCWTKVLDVSLGNILRATIDRLFSEQSDRAGRVWDLEMAIREKASEADIDIFGTKWKEYVEQKQDEYVKQEHVEDDEQEGGKHAEQREGGDVKQDQDKDNEQEPDKEVKKKDDGHAKQQDAKQRECEEARVMMATYAQQDRYDSCSDSD
jgi:hypothetical protein